MRVFRVNDCDWWMAETAEQAKSAAIEFYGEDMVDEVRELTDGQLNSHTFYDQGDETTKTFGQQLLKRIKEGVTKPELFASTEY